MTDLARIVNSNATVRAEHAPSINAAFVKLHELTGVWPVVKAGWETRDGIPGGSRTLAEAIKAGSGPTSDHFEGNAKGRAAVDIDNHRLLRNILGSEYFEAILAAEGWRNIQINGQPFPSEPWHFANHNPAPKPTQEDEDDTMLYYKDAETQIVYSRNPDAPAGEPQLAIVGKTPSQSVAYTVGKLDLAKVLTITGPQMTQLVNLYGVKPVSPAAHALWSGNRPVVKGLTL